jgi:hypothetical protein
MNGTIWGCVGSTTAHMLMLDVDVVDIVVLRVRSYITKIADPQQDAVGIELITLDAKNPDRPT